MDEIKDEPPLYSNLKSSDEISNSDYKFFRFKIK